MEKWLDEEASEHPERGEGFFHDELAYSMSRAAEAVWDSAMRAQKFVKENAA